MSRRLLPALAVLGTLALAGAAWWWLRGRAPERWNVVFVLVDTLRADRLSLYGNQRPTSPRLVELARTGIVLRRNWSQAGCTFPSVNALLTSQPPTRFLGQAERRMGIPDGVPSLPRALRAAGYATVAVSSSPVVRATANQVNRHGGFGGGFDRFEEACWRLPGRCVNQAAERLLPMLPEPFFLYLHYMEPHAPYRPPAEHRWRFRRRRNAKPFVLRGDPTPFNDMLYRGGPPIEISADDRLELGNAYDEEIRYFDRLFGELMERLGRDGLLDRTVVVLASDHGEELLDHDELGHCRDVAFETTLGTPMVWWVPGLAPATRDGLASNADLAPTLLDLLGLPPLPAAEGRSLRPLLASGRPVNPLVYAVQGRRQAVTDGRWKLLRDAASGERWLYDLEADPGERTPVAAAPADVAARLETALERWLQRVTGGDQAGALRDALEAERQLRAVGYL